MAILTSELERLGRLHSDGVLTEEEFRAAKARLLQTSVESRGTTVFVAHCPSCGAGIVGTLAEQAEQTKAGSSK